MNTARVLMTNGWTRQLSLNMVSEGEMITLAGYQANDPRTHKVFATNVIRPNGATLVMGLVK